ncbi:hypothetical protein Desor_3127 [Desulfosporosinus orientis DSM 765]|uniref:Cyclophilin-like domain-containing protein n=1 Tax=Desulfosporosinus orientis (strain ATCC 19365 / DSM 765 / NCIMB 8382 / VKM B-1628 / Singapore I) TaxID=768706 RepID=G7W6K3_DESOD|nr:cyclophilin-like fold protein [Desulfosporosinus orientis]AET68641.1 hypothetical protein Desor_3127 [Desulfosporosinus orientis DSM 765]
MKRLCVWIFAAALLISLSACSSNKAAPQNNSSESLTIIDNTESGQETEVSAIDDTETADINTSVPSETPGIQESASDALVTSSPENSGTTRPSTATDTSAPALTQPAETAKPPNPPTLAPTQPAETARPSTAPDSQTPSPAKPTESEEPTNMETSEIKVRITVSGQELTAALDNNATTQALIKKLPLTLPMMDLYGREMCYRFTDELPANEVQTRNFQLGEIIYWPPRHSFVIMYKQDGEQFSMQHVGQIDSGVEIFNETGDAEVTFELIDD